LKLILFVHRDACKKGDVLKTVINHNFTGSKHQTINAFNALRTRLKKCSGFAEKEIFILLADSMIRLTQLMSLIELLEGRHIILILPDGSKATLSKASQFFPRFFTPVSETYHDLCDVLNKMINQERIKPEEY